VAEILLEVEEGKGGASELLNAAAHRWGFRGRDRSVLTRWVYDGVRRKGTLDALIHAFGGKRKRALDPRLRAALRIGVYEILYARGVPDYAAVSEAVKLAKTLAGSGAGKLCNAVLRNVTRGTRFSPTKPEEPFATDGLAVGEGKWAVFARKVFPPADRPAERLASMHSHPLWLVKRWVSRFGIEGTARLLSENNRRPPLTVRLRGGPGVKPPEGLKAERTREGDIFLLEEAENVSALPGFREGRITVQDETASQPVRFLSIDPGSCLLDLCAAPGGKTVQMADALQGEGRVVALEFHKARIAMIREALERMEGGPVFPVAGDGTRPPFPESAFDRVLIDAPCSNTGVLRRRVEARWRLTREGIRNRVKLQTALLGAGALRVRPGGRVVYSTCSLEKEENHDVVAGFLAEREGFRLVAEETVLPGRGDGGYWAVLAREPGNRAGF
jgi:16S rRNA (cytosine967-C5)-methyltransferase